MDVQERPLDEGERGERASRERKRGFGTSEADLQSPLWDWLYTTGVPLLVSAGNCHLLGATSFLSTSPSSAHSHPLLSFSLLVCAQPSFLLYRTDPATLEKHGRELFRKHFTVESSETDSRPTSSSIYPYHCRRYNLLPLPSSHTYTHDLACCCNCRAKNCAAEKSGHRSRRLLFIRGRRSINVEHLVVKVFDLSKEC